MRLLQTGIFSKLEKLDDIMKAKEIILFDCRSHDKKLGLLS